MTAWRCFAHASPYEGETRIARRAECRLDLASNHQGSLRKSLARILPRTKGRARAMCLLPPASSLSNYWPLTLICRPADWTDGGRSSSSNGGGVAATATTTREEGRCDPFVNQEMETSTRAPAASISVRARRRRAFITVGEE